MRLLKLELCKTLTNKKNILILVFFLVVYVAMVFLLHISVLEKRKTITNMYRS